MAFFRGDPDPFSDPFFSGANHRPLMPNFGDPFEGVFGRQPGIPAVASAPHSMLMPFGGHMMMMDPFSRMNEMMKNMHNMSNNPGCQSFSQSTVMHVTHDQSSGGQPKVYQASVSSRSGPGGVKETNKMERDSVTGTQKTSVSHQIDNRSRTLNKKYNFKTKEAEQVKEFINVDEEDEQFDVEWKQKTQKLNSIDPHQHGGLSSALSRGLPSSSSDATPTGGLPKINTQRNSRYTPYTSDNTGRRQHPRDPLQNPADHNGSHHMQTQRKKKSSRVQFHQ